MSEEKIIYKLDKFNLSTLPDNFITHIIGRRFCGKTWLIYDIINSLIEKSFKLIHLFLITNCCRTYKEYSEYYYGIDINRNIDDIIKIHSPNETICVIFDDALDMTINEYMCKLIHYKDKINVIISSQSMTWNINFLKAYYVFLFNEWRQISKERFYNAYGNFIESPDIFLKYYMNNVGGYKTLVINQNDKKMYQHKTGDINHVDKKYYKNARNI